MKLARFQKKPGERKRYAIDYSQWLDQGETVQSASFVVAPTAAGGIEVDAFTIGSPAVTVIYFVNAGQAGVDYELEIRIETSGGQIKKDTVLYSVR